MADVISGNKSDGYTFTCPCGFTSSGWATKAKATTRGVVDGWVVLDYDGATRARLHIAVDDPKKQLPAFRDTIDGRRVLKVRSPAGLSGRARVWLVVDGVPGKPSTVSL